MNEFIDKLVNSFNTLGYHQTEEIREIILSSGYDYFDAGEYLQSKYGICI